MGSFEGKQHVNDSLSRVLNMEKTQQFLKETEAAAQDVLITKQDIIAMDQRRQKVREALWALKKDEKQKPDGKTWLSIGSLFVKTRTDKSKNLLERGISNDFYFKKTIPLLIIYYFDDI